MNAVASKPKLIAYHGEKKEKAAILRQLAAHRKADEIQKGFYWEGGKGCAVGCTLHSSNHMLYEKRFGIPVLLARLEDQIFEGLPNGKAKEWPERFMSAIRVGADLSMVWPKFALWLLIDPKHGVIKYAKKEQAKTAIQRVGDLFQRTVGGEKISTEDWRSARDAAYAADADAAAYAAYAADAADADADAYAAYAADAADAAYAADAAARSKHYEIMADKLIEIIKTCC